MFMGENIVSFWNWCLDVAKKQGVPFMLLCSAIIYFNSQLDKMEIKIEACNNENRNLMKTSINEMKEIIIRNTQAFENLKENK